MSEPLVPVDEAEVAALVSAAASDGITLSVMGGGTRSGLGRPMAADAVVSARNLSGITLYEPAEMVLSAKAGTPLADVEQVLAEHGQRLAFEPIDHRRIYGSEGGPTIGAVAAANLSGSRRIEVGAARDSLIGVRAVSGRGEIIHSGGRVMKNVTGYDLVKFLAGSYGTLAILTEVTFKVAPVPQTERTIAVSGLAPQAAIATMTTALGSPWAVSGAAHLPPRADASSITALRLEGFAGSVAERCDKLIALLGKPSGLEVLDDVASGRMWSSIRDLSALQQAPDDPIWRVSVKPGDGPAMAEAVGDFAQAALFDWGGGLVWMVGGSHGDAGASSIRDAVARFGGHATLVRASDDLRAGVEVFQPLAPALMRLTRQLKQSFDPSGILNPGRMYDGV